MSARYNKGDRVKLRAMFVGDPFAGAVGVIVKVTHGHRLYKVWLDKPVRVRATGKGRSYVGPYELVLAHCSAGMIEDGVTDEGEWYIVVPPRWRTEEAFYNEIRNGLFEIVERSTGRVVDSSARGWKQAFARRERITFMTAAAERKAACA